MKRGEDGARLGARVSRLDGRAVVALVGLALLVAGAIGCIGPEPDVASRAQALQYGAPDRPRFYEVRVPYDVDPGEIIDVHGIGLFPSADPRDEEGLWYVALLNREGLERALELGLDVQRARRSALRPEELDAFEADGAFVDDEAELDAAGFDEPMAPTPGCDASTWEVFCRYRNEDPDNDLCTNSITAELAALAASDPSYARFVKITTTTTAEGRQLVGLRVGTQSGGNVPQLLVFGAQHAREWAASGLVLSLARRLAKLPVGDPIRNELKTRAVLLIPVANPDGYAFTFTGGANERLWRPNRNSCGGGLLGIDPNRNFPFSWHPNINTCGDGTYGGAAAGDQAETTLLTWMFLNNGLYSPPQATYATRFTVNYHAFGNYILFPDGLTDADDRATGLPCREPDPGVVGVYKAYNCQPPDFAVLRWIAGSEAEPRLVDELTGRPYSSDTVWRTLYGSDGDQMSHHAFSHTIRDFDKALDRRSLGLGIEANASSVGFLAECMPQAQWNAFVENHWSFLKIVIQNLDEVSSETSVVAVPALGTWIGPTVHRLRSNDDVSATTYGPPRFWIDQQQSLPSPSIGTPTGYEGDTDGWSTAGRFFKTWRWTPDAPYVFPPRFTICQGQDCEAVDIDGPINLCAADLFGTKTGWQFWGQNGTSSDDCYLELTGRGEGPFVLQRNPRSMAQADRVHLNYSYRMDHYAFGSEGRVEVDVSAAYGPWIRVRTYPPERFGGHVTKQPTEESVDGQTSLRTELIDLPPEFDFQSNIRVRFRAFKVGTPSPPTGFPFRVYDVVLIGRHVE